MTTPPEPTMPWPTRTIHTPRVYRYVVTSPAHADTLFGAGTLLYARAVAALAGQAGAVLVESLGGTAVATVTTAALTNGAEIANALGSITGAVAFQVRTMATAPVEPMPDCGPPSRDPSLAAVEVEVVRLRKVEAAARALLASLPQCGWCSKRVATCAKRGVECCDRCAEIGDGMVFGSLNAEQVRALEAALAPVSEAALST